MKKKKVWGIWDRQERYWCWLEFWEFETTAILNLKNKKLCNSSWENAEIRPCHLPNPLPKKRGNE